MEVPEPDADRHVAAPVAEEGDRAGAAAWRLLQGHGLGRAEEGSGHARITICIGFRGFLIKLRGKTAFPTSVVYFSVTSNHVKLIVSRASNTRDGTVVFLLLLINNESTYSSVSHFAPSGVHVFTLQE